MTSNLRLLSFIASAYIFANTAQDLIYASLGNDDAGKLQTDVQNKLLIAEGLSGTSSAFTRPRVYAIRKLYGSVYLFSTSLNLAFD